MDTIILTCLLAQTFPTDLQINDCNIIVNAPIGFSHEGKRHSLKVTVSFFNGMWHAESTATITDGCYMGYGSAVSYLYSKGYPTKEDAINSQIDRFRTMWNNNVPIKNCPL